jgi:protein-tyrosine phosphatase
MVAPTAHPDRHLRLEACFNFRDLGGYPTDDGGRVRWRTLYRADGLNRMTATDAQQVRGLGIRTVIDLRTEDEVAERGRVPVEPLGVSYHHLPMLDVVWDASDVPDPAPEDFVFGKYVEMMTTGEWCIAEALRVLADPDGHPAVFHCAAGKDRTGMLAAVVLGLLGVPDQAIVEDYALSQPAMQEMMAWFLANAPDGTDLSVRPPAVFLAAEHATMQSLLDHVRDTHGSMDGWVRDHLGVEPAVVERLRAALVE